MQPSIYILNDQYINTYTNYNVFLYSLPIYYYFLYIKYIKNMNKFCSYTRIIHQNVILLFTVFKYLFEN